MRWREEWKKNVLRSQKNNIPWALILTRDEFNKTMSLVKLINSIQKQTKTSF